MEKESEETMIKKLIILLSLFFLVSCSSPSSSDYVPKAFPVDMSGYQGIRSTEHCFEGTTVSELIRCIDEKGNGIFIISATWCQHCQLFMRHLNKIALEEGVTIYYISADYPEDNPYPIDDEEVDLIKEYFYPYLATDPDTHEKEVYTPHLFSIVNGRVLDSQLSGKETGDEEKDGENIERVFRKILERYLKKTEG